MTHKIYKLTGNALAKITAIERQQVFPWTDTQLQECFTAGYECFALDIHRKTVGFVIFSMVISTHESEILNIAIEQSQRRRGYGRLLLDFVLQQAQQTGIEKIFLEVRISNIAAINLYEQAGFKRVGIRKGYYRAANGREDAIILCFVFPGI